MTTRGRNDGGRLHRLQHGIDSAKRAVKARLGRFRPVEIQAYRSHGTGAELRVIGRVVEKRGVKEQDGDASLMRNIANTVRRLESDEIPGARVRAVGAGATAERETDHEGFFEIRLEPSADLSPGWHEVELTLLESIAGGGGVTATAEVMVPPGDAEFGVISDLDDTVIRTQATDFLTQARVTFANSPQTRTSMPGASPLYRALDRGADGEGWNPFFYVSRSGWGLYDLFEQFLDRNDLPKGAILLHDIAIVEAKSDQLGNERHKHDEIHDILDRHKDLQFVLIGDSGQDDPETYLEIARDNPDRVRAVLIRDVTTSERDREVRRIMQKINDLGVDAAAAESSVSMARAAADFRLISHDAIDEVREAMVKDEV